MAGQAGTRWAGPVPMPDLLAWLGDDVAAAAPLMGAFTSHDTSIEHAVIPVDPAEAERVAGWLRAGSAPRWRSWMPR